MAFPAFQERLRQLFRLAKFDGGVVSKSAPVVEVVQTWNNPNETFFGKINNFYGSGSGTSVAEAWRFNGARIAEFRPCANGSLWIGINAAGYIYEYAGGQLGFAAGGHGMVLANGQGASGPGLLVPSIVHAPYQTDLLLQSGGTYSNGQSAGHLKLQAGTNWAGGTNQNGGSVYVDAGLGSGTGTNGSVYINTVNKLSLVASRLRADGFATAFAAKTANYTSTPDDGTLTFDATSGALVHTLETAVGANGRIKVICKIDASANTVTIDPNGSETINGAATLVLSAQWDKAIIQSDGANWIRIA